MIKWIKVHLEAPRNKLCVFEIDATTLKIPENMNSYCPYIHLIKPTKKRHTHTHTHTYYLTDTEKGKRDSRLQNEKDKNPDNETRPYYIHHSHCYNWERERDNYILISWLRVAKFPFCCVQENKENGKVIHPEMLVFFTLSFCFGTEN